MYTALYRAYRPEVFDEILGQNHITKILKNQLATDSDRKSTRLNSSHRSLSRMPSSA